jgi:glycosyltransferase involved in cell wall biosynthesis
MGRLPDSACPRVAGAAKIALLAAERAAFRTRERPMVSSEAATHPGTHEDRTSPRLSVITAVHDKAVRFLPAAAASLAAQTAAPRWIVCYDGDRVPDDLLDEVGAACRSAVPGVRFVSSGRAAGPSTARTMALSHVDTPYTAVLDADDTWLPGGLDRLLRTAEETDAAWCAGLSVDVREGRATTFPDYLPTGPQAAGAVFEAYERLGFLPFHGCAVVWRTDVLWRCGGWPALASSEDSGLVLAASEEYAGWYVGGEPVYGYTRHDDQTTALAGYSDRRAMAVRHNRRRILSMRGPR